MRVEEVFDEHGLLLEEIIRCVWTELDGQIHIFDERQEGHYDLTDEGVIQHIPLLQLAEALVLLPIWRLSEGLLAGQRMLVPWLLQGEYSYFLVLRAFLYVLALHACLNLLQLVVCLCYLDFLLSGLYLYAFLQLIHFLEFFLAIRFGFIVQNLYLFFVFLQWIFECLIKLFYIHYFLLFFCFYMFFLKYIFLL